MHEMETYETVCRKCGFDESRYSCPSHVLQPHTVLNRRYMVGEVLGSGGFGITYIAWDTVLDRKVAIKEYFVDGAMYRNSTESTFVVTGNTTERQRKVTICALVQVLLGEKVVVLVPAVMPLSTAQRTAS